jgi:hypothetical protein
METLKFLQENSLSALTDEFSIKVRQYPDCNLAVLNYNQINSPKYHPIIRECRGLIIDYEDRVPVARAFPRFFNLNEWQEDPFDFTNIHQIEEKADGSLITVYWWNGAWNIATRGTAFGEASLIMGDIKDFRSLFIKIIDTPIDTFMSRMSPEYSYVFELCSPYNKVIKLYREPKVYLTGAFNVSTGEELDRFHLDYCAGALNVSRPIVYGFDDFNTDKLMESFKDMHPTDEGYVLIDCNRNRIKVKNPSYVNLHHMKGDGALTSKRICDIVFRGEVEEVLSYFPEFHDIITPYQEVYNLVMDEIDQVYEKYKDIEDQKEFALSVKDLPYASVLFSLRKGLTKSEILSNLSSDAKIKILSQSRNLLKG